MAVRDLAGQRFGRLLVLHRHPENTPAGKARWTCACDCGGEKVVIGNSLTQGSTVSCGCFHAEVTTARSSKHGHSPRRAVTTTYRVWADMVKRCTNPNHWAWRYYGGRGVTVCERWRASFESFLADMGERPVPLTLDRINNDGNYEPGNCRWATRKEQSRNRRKPAVRVSAGGR